MKLRTIKALFSIIIGVSIISLWIMLYLSNQIPELKTEPVNITLHIFSEILLAIILIIASIQLINKSRNSEKTFLISMGLLLYSVINAAGYYGQNENWVMVVLFSLLFIFSTIFIFISLKNQD